MARGGPRIWFAGGGTGGHLFPALAVAELLSKDRPDVWIGFLGGRRGLETRLVPAAGFPLRTLPMAGLKGAGPLRRAGAAALAAVATARCAGAFVAARPALVVGVGGYASGPAVLAAIATGVRTALLEQNHYPGATNRWLARFAGRICVPSEAARERLGGRGVVTGNPVREAFAAIGPPPGGPLPTLLVFGGSRGARSINRAVASALPGLAALPTPPRILHQTGEADRAEVASAYGASYPSDRFEVRAFLDDMPARLAAADLVLCRAGATTLAELAAAGRPAVLVPYPHAADDHQRHNAETVAAAGAAVVVRDDALSADALVATLAPLLQDPARRAAMAAAQRKLARPDAGRRIVDLLTAMLPPAASPAAAGGNG